MSKLSGYCDNNGHVIYTSHLLLSPLRDYEASCFVGDLVIFSFSENKKMAVGVYVVIKCTTMGVC